MVNVRSIVRLFTGQTISQVFDRVAGIGMVWVIAEYSPAMIPWFLAISKIPHLILGPFSSRFVNRLGIAKTVVLADVIRGLLFLPLPFFINNIEAKWTVWTLFIVTFLCGIMGSLFNPAIRTAPLYFSDSEHLHKVNALMETRYAASNILGPFIAVLIFNHNGLAGIIMANVLSYFFAVMLEYGLETVTMIKEVEHPDIAKISSNKPNRMREVLKKDNIVSLLLLHCLMINIFLTPVMAFIPSYVKTIYQGGSIQDLATLELSLGVGSVVGALLPLFLSFRKGMGSKISVLFVCSAIGYIIFGHASGLMFGCIGLAVLGFFLSIGNALILRVYQLRTSASDVPVVMSIVNLITTAMQPISMTLLAILSERFAISSLGAVYSYLVLLLAFSIAFIPGIRRI